MLSTRNRFLRLDRTYCDLKARVDRTVEYLDALLAGPLDPTTRAVVTATRRSLTTTAKEQQP